MRGESRGVEEEGDWQSRELATVGMLSALPGAEAQLQSHITHQHELGLTAGQLRQLTQVLADRVGTDNAGVYARHWSGNGVPNPEADVSALAEL